MLLTLLALTTPLCLDSFLIAAAIGLTKPSRRDKLRITVLFAGFEAGMPLVGLLIGRSLSGSMGHNAIYLAAAILIAYGFYSVLRQPEEDKAARQLGKTHGLAALVIGASISLDGLAIGFTYGLIQVPVILVTALIAFQAVVFTLLGFKIGGALPEHLRQRGEQLAGLALMGIGIILLVKQLFS